MLATAASIAEVPVPEVAIVNACSSALKRRRSDRRTSSSSGTKSGSRWLSTGAAMARITRGAMRLGPGPSRIRSVDGSGIRTKTSFGELARDGGRGFGPAVNEWQRVERLELRAQSPDHLGRRPAQRWPGWSAGVAEQVERGLERGH